MLIYQGKVAKDLEELITGLYPISEDDEIFLYDDEISLGGDEISLYGDEISLDNE